MLRSITTHSKTATSPRRRHRPGGLTFDTSGSLYVASDEGSTGAVVEYKSTDLDSGDKPNVVDATGINASPYGSDLQFEKTGDRYDGDAGIVPESPRTSGACVFNKPLGTNAIGH